ncbi:GDSL-type esterase/lipase family protein [Flagellimonas myxillae]|uniref:GDSL-type esterase/lipase family protein n=1 Tax=Flagellimonas myxillae TaxID=2942214 RepID=UPI00201E8844|nr:GDSL-type esterase/lipase family protein [Muricauda myxillae]MCL6266331.1 GDSL-type esterase/lipase family protein [Muricauda myxillae]
MYKSMISAVLFLITINLFNSCKESSKAAEERFKRPIPMATLESIYPSGDLVIPSHSEFTKEHYPERIAEFMSDPLQPNDIVFMGNSITEQGGMWNEKLDKHNAKNRGISGDTSEGVLARLGELVYFKPSQVFILIGINDLFHNDINPENVYENIVKTVDKLNKESPQTEIFVQTILPTTSVDLVEKIQITNQLIKSNAGKVGYNLIDLYPLFRSKSEFLNMDYSYDGVHLNEKGYAVWVNKVKPFVK